MTIGSKYGRMRKRTLENYCHNVTVTKENWKCSDGSKRQQGCFLYNTKSDNLSESLAHSIDTAEQFRNFKELGLLPSLNKISAYEFTCLDSAERAVRKVNDELMKKNSKSEKTPDTPTGITDKPRRTGGW